MNTHAVVENERVEEQLEQRSTTDATGLVPVARQKALFEDSLLEASSGQRKRRTWATLLSIVLQCLLVGVLILIPLLFTDVLPKQQL